jgi:hypothetical protein
MSNIKISINPLMDFSTGTEAKKTRIIKDSKNPNPFRIGWYQTPRACIKKSIMLGGEHEPIVDGIKRLQDKVVTKKQQVSNKIVSIEAMNRYLSVNLPKIFKNHNFEIIKERPTKSIFINGVEVIVSPDIIYLMEHNEEMYIGAVKLHMSKGNIFDVSKCSNVATLIYMYLEELSDRYGAKVLPELCFSYDVFGGRFISAKGINRKSQRKILKICDEVKLLWNA